MERKVISPPVSAFSPLSTTQLVCPDLPAEEGLVKNCLYFYEFYIRL